MIEVSFNDIVLRTSTTALPLNTWTLVSVYIGVFDKGTKLTAATLIYFGRTLSHYYPTDNTFNDYANLNAETASDTFMIGGVAGSRQGFEGSLLNFVIVYKSSSSINDGKCFLKIIFV